MIVDIISSKADKLADKFSLNSWQKGLLGDLLLLGPPECHQSDHVIRSINMGYSSGHTYFACVAARVEFPLRTKVYIVDPSQYPEFGTLIFRPHRCHEDIEVMESKNFPGYRGNHVDLIVIDFDSQDAHSYRQSFYSLIASVNPDTQILMLEPSF